MMQILMLLTKKEKKKETFAHHNSIKVSLNVRICTRTPVMPLHEPDPNPNTPCLFSLNQLNLRHPDALLLLEDFCACVSPAAVQGPVWILEIFALPKNQSHLCFSGQSRFLTHVVSGSFVLPL